jgi:KTSC domain
MRRVTVDSSSIAWIGYDPKRQELEVKFRDSGDIYRYFEVTPGEYAAFMASKSKGKYLNYIFKPRGHRYFVVKAGRQQ